MPEAPRVFWTDTAFRDLADILDHIAAASPAAALDVLARVRARAAALRSHPRRGRPVPELLEHGVRAYRELVLPPWRVLYRIEGRRVWVVSVLDSRRNAEDLLLDRFLRRGSRPQECFQAGLRFSRKALQPSTPSCVASRSLR